MFRLITKGKQVRRFILGIVVLSQMLMLTACSSLLKPVKVADKAIYTIELPMQHGRRSTRFKDKTLLVSAPRSAPGYAEKRIMYTKDNVQMQYYAHNQWAARPASMVQHAIIQPLMTSGLYKAVVSAPFSGLTDYRLDEHILKFRLELEPNHEQFHFSSMVNIIDVETHRVVASRLFDVREPLSSVSPESGVYAANRAIGRYANALVSYLANLTV